MMNIHEALNWRYAVKKFSDKIVPQEKVDAIVANINLSASSAGIQPYRLVIVNNKDLQKELGEGSFNSQIADASHLLVFAAWENVEPAYIENYINLIAKTPNIPADAVSDFKNKLDAYLLGRSAEENFAWATKQAYIALGTGLLAAAELEVDATPMEGFDMDQFDELLHLKAKGLKSVVIMALGYRDAEKDVFSKLKKVRLPIEEFTIG